VAGVIAFEAILAGYAPTDAAAAVTDRAVAAQLDRQSDRDDRMAVGLALHRAGRVFDGS
jgi:predicted transcriptional regulator